MTARFTATRAMIRFRCLAAECPDNCCHGWRVVIDRKHHDLLLAQLPAEEAGAATKLLGGDEPQRHALAVLDERGHCGFEDAGRLCSIQTRFGEALLPD